MDDLVIGIIFIAILSTIPAVIAPSRGRRAVEWFALSLLFSPLIALILVLLLPPKKADNTASPIAAEHPLAHWGEDR